MLCFVVLTVLSACAPPVQPPPYPPREVHIAQQADQEAKAKKAELEAEAEAQLEEFSDRWKRWKAKTQEIRAELEAINQESTLVANHPGWPDMAQILKNFTSIRYLEGEESAVRKRTVALTQWSQKWQANGEEIYEKSQFLLNRITVAQATFQELEKDYEYVMGTLMAWTLLESAAKGLSDADFLLDALETSFYEPNRKTRSELFTLLKNPLITLGFVEKEKQ
jgi:hypothetical protein